MASLEVVTLMRDAPAEPPGRKSTFGITARGIRFEPVFSETPEAPEAPSRAGDDIGGAPPLPRFLRAVVDADSAVAIAEELLARPDIAAAYVKPPVEPPLFRMPNGVADPEAEGADLAEAPDYTDLQGYLNPAPIGVDARAAWAEPGGRGDGVAIIDIEGGWCLEHRDLAGNAGLRGGSSLPGSGWRDHGTAVLGVMAANEGGIGVTGIAPAASVSAYSHSPGGSAGAIQRAANMLSAGDILLLEMHRPGPRHGFRTRRDQAGYIAVEWWPDDLAAIQYAVSLGIIVVEAAGNGSEDLDNDLYDNADRGFPETWVNPFRHVDSGAIVVGAGAPDGGQFGEARSRLDFSNYGSRLDAQGWGEGVCSSGYGDLFAGSGEIDFYTAQFNGTSSASPVVAGAVACLQGIALARGTTLAPARVRELIRGGGSTQAGDTSQRIGTLPDLNELIGSL